MWRAIYNYFEGITVRTTNVAFLLGLKNIAAPAASPQTLAHRKCWPRRPDAMVSSKNFYIADNVSFTGRRYDQRLSLVPVHAQRGKLPFQLITLGSNAVKVYGQRHVVAYNHAAANRHDGNRHRHPRASRWNAQPHFRPARSVAIDFTITTSPTPPNNCIAEADGGSSQYPRVFRNRCLNATSAQPIFGGPLYIYQKRRSQHDHRRSPSSSISPCRVLVYQNTFIGQAASWALFLNAFPQQPDLRRRLLRARAPLLRSYTNATPQSDYNGFRENTNTEDASSSGTHPHREPSAILSRPATKPCRLHAQGVRATQAARQQQHRSDYDASRKWRCPTRTTPNTSHNPDDLDFRLRSGSTV